MNNNELLREKLLTILQRVDEWLKYAEAKNGILLAFSGAGITALVTYISASDNLPKSLFWGLLISMILLSLCSLICSLSFLPRTNLEKIVYLRGNPSRNLRQSQKDTDNFYYFGHLLKYKDLELLEKLNKLYFDNKIQSDFEKEHLDIASQIVINSEITWLKFKLFFFSLWILIISIAVIPIFILISLIIFRKI